MGQELAFALINPYTIEKSRTGGVIARFIGRTGLHFAGARMFGPSRELVEEYSSLVRHADPSSAEVTGLIADYILKRYAPDRTTGRPRRVLMLLFEGENAVEKVWNVTGSVKLKWGSGATIRDTYGDYIENDKGGVQYFEPAVLVGPTPQRAAATLRLWAKYSERDGGIVEHADDVPDGSESERTLVLLKPDNFRYPSLRAGNIIDILSCSGLRIVGAKKIRMTVAQAERFYGPVREALAAKFPAIALPRAAAALSREFGFDVPLEALRPSCGALGPLFAEAQFDEIVEFMTGYRPSRCAPEQRETLSREEGLALVYQGIQAVGKIREILGETDPNKARPGSVRREFGSNIMVNAAHASDSAANAQRELGIIRVAEDTIRPLVEKYHGPVEPVAAK
jgi:nucleoside diphosphate kinase